MITIAADKLRALVTRMFLKVGSTAAEAEKVAHYLVESNLVGHDSHGVIRVPTYVDWVQRDMVRVNQSLQVVHQSGGLAIVDGRYGLGQVIGEQAVDLGIALAREHGVAAVALRNSGHLGRIGDWPQRAARAGLASFHFVNTSGFGLLVAPFGGVERRLSANPIAAGFPLDGREPLVLDISTSAIAEGKLKVARNAGKRVPENCIIDNRGQPTTEPADFYATPPGALLPFGGHKGYALSVMAEMFAGALTGGGCTDPQQTVRLLNGMFSFYVDPRHVGSHYDVQGEARRFIEYVKSARRVDEAVEILVPGEIEQRTRRERLEHGIELDANTWASIRSSAEQLGVAAMA